MDFFSRGLQAEYKSKGIIIQVCPQTHISAAATSPHGRGFWWLKQRIQSLHQNWAIWCVNIWYKENPLSEWRFNKNKCFLNTVLIFYQVVKLNTLFINVTAEVFSFFPRVFCHFLLQPSWVKSDGPRWINPVQSATLQLSSTLWGCRPKPTATCPTLLW